MVSVDDGACPRPLTHGGLGVPGWNIRGIERLLLLMALDDNQKQMPLRIACFLYITSCMFWMYFDRR